MRIGFLGNVNNYPFILAKYYKSIGIDVTFFVDAEKHDKLHRPEHLHNGISYPYPEWIHEIPQPKNILELAFPGFFRKSVVRQLNQCDAVILNGYGHAIKPFLKKNIPSISLFSGADLDVLADYKNAASFSKVDKSYLKILQPLKKLLVHKNIRTHREGIRQALVLSYFPAGIVPEADKLMQEIKGETAFNRFSHFHIPVEGVESSPPPQNEKIRIFNLARFIWKKPLPHGYNAQENKGNDVMIRGIASFYKQHNIQLDVHFVEKGIHVQESKELLAELGISHLVTWHTEMSHKDIFQFYRTSDIIFEQLGSHFVGGGLYAMLVGRPLIANGRPEIFEPIIGEKAPICQATTPEEVSNWLGKLVFDANLRKEIGERSRAYVLENFDINREADFFLETIQKAIKTEQVV